MELNQLSAKIIAAAINVHKDLGPGLLESVYQSCMIVELKDMNINVQAEVPLPIFYHGQKVSEEGFRLDLLVEDLIVVELKSVEQVQPVHKKQLLLAPCSVKLLHWGLICVWLTSHSAY